MRIATAAALLCVCSLARAWEVDLAKTAQRLSELERAWAGKDEAAIQQDKMARARQRKAPAWVGKTGWEERHQGKVYRFGVGSMQGSRNPIFLMQGAESRARGEVSMMKGGEFEPERNPGPGGKPSSRAAKAGAGIAALDWYLDEAEGVLYALVAEVW